MLLRLRTIALSLLALFVLGGADAVRAADDAPTVMFLLDGSGSMWGPFGNERRSKFEIGRETLAQTIARIRPDARMGLSSFGHRRRGYCGDVEVIVPPDANNLEKITTPLPKLNANGMGPVALGLRETAKAIATAVPAAIVMIHDDVDNCSPDTCVAAAEIAKANPNLAIYSIGLGIGPQKLQQMSCVANATHGRAYDAQDTAGLISALDEILKLANLEPNAAPATGTTFDAMLATGRLELTAARGNGSDPADVSTPGVTFIVYEDDPDSPQGRREVTRSAAPSPSFTLPAGTYYVTARMGGSELKEQLALGAGDAVKRTFAFNLAHLKLSAKIDGAPSLDALPLTYTVFRLDGEPREVVRTQAKEPDLELSAGRYRVEASLGATNVRAAAEVTLTPGQAQKIALKLDAGRVTLRLASEQGSSAGDVFWEVRDDKKQFVLRSSEPQPTALLAPGRYIVTSETRDKQLRSAFELKAGETRTFDVGG